MPFVSVSYFAGPTTDERRRLQEGLAKTVIETFGAPPANVRVITRAVDRSDVYVASGQTEIGMPIVRVEFLPGRTPEQKRALLKGVAQVVSEALSVPPEQVRTILYEKVREDWARGAVSMADM